MKNLFTLVVYFLVGSASAQFSESFFDRITSGSASDYNHFYGTERQNGVLLVKFADSVNTEVQWATVDLQGHEQTYSSDLPNDYISPNESIIELFEIGSTQFIVTQDSASNNQEGIRIHKYQNFTTYLGTYEYPTQLRNAHAQAYLYNNKIQVFFAEQGGNFKRIKVNPTSMSLDSEVSMGSFFFNTQNAQQHFKKIHVLFQDDNNLQIFTNSDTDLIRMRIINNVVQAVESRALNILKVLGVNQFNNQVICLQTTNPEVLRYNSNINSPLSAALLINSFDLPTVSGSFFNWKYGNDGVNELFVFDQTKLILQVANNQITAQKTSAFNFNLTNIDFMLGKPILMGSRLIENFGSQQLNSLFVSYGTVDQLNDFKEYSAFFDFGGHDVKFGLGPNFWRQVNGSANGDYLFANLCYGASMCLVGKSNGLIYGQNTNYYGQNTNFEGDSYYPGPYTNPAQFNQEQIRAYNESFYVTKDMLNYHVYAIENNLPNYVVPKGIINWPAHGDISKGQAANLAPFIDLNNDGLYQPLLGEYPVFPGDFCVMNITHQHESFAQQSGSGLEIHNYMYQFDCSDSLEDVIFVRMDVFNRGPISYDSLAVGTFSDFDIGYYNDDYVGTHVENGMIYATNGDLYDEAFGGFGGFLDSIPSFGIQFLKGNPVPANGTDDLPGLLLNSVNGVGFNDQIIDNEFTGLQFSIGTTSTGSSMYSDPFYDDEFFNVLTGHHLHGEQQDFASTTIESRFVYPDDSDPLNYGTYGIDPGFIWSEASMTNLVGDRRIYASFGSTPLNSGQSISYHLSMVSGKRIPGTGQSQLDLFAKAAHVKQAFHNNQTSCGQTFDNLTEDQITAVKKTAKQAVVKLYPNPAKTEFFVEIQHLDENSMLEMTDINGKRVLTQKLEQTKTAVQAADLQNGIYFIHIVSPDFTGTIKFVKQD